MSRFYAGPLAGLFAAATFMTGCSSSDNLNSGGREYPVFPGISNTQVEQKYDRVATFGADLPYQVALIYEVVLNGRGYDQITRPVTMPQGTRDCAVDGFIEHAKSSQAVITPFGQGPLDVSQVLASGCTVEEGGDDTERMTLGAFVTTAGDVVCKKANEDDEDEPCEIAYTLYNGYYGVQYLKPLGAGVHDWKRVELGGYTVDGPGKADLTAAGGAIEAVEEQQQRLVMFSSTAERSATGTATGEKVFAVQYGANSVPFVVQKLVSNDRLRLTGVLSSGVNRDDCPGGRFRVDPVDDQLLQLVGDDLTAGKLALKAGNGSNEKHATLTFLAGGDVEIVVGTDAPVMVTREDIEDLRTECFQTVAVKG